MPPPSVIDPERLGGRRWARCRNGHSSVLEEMSMLHAVIRSSRDAMHFFAEVNGYNLQTLRQHVRQTNREDGPVHLRVEIDPHDQAAFVHYSTRWLRALSQRGAAVEVEVMQAG